MCLIVHAWFRCKLEKYVKTRGRVVRRLRALSIVPAAGGLCSIPKSRACRRQHLGRRPAAEAHEPFDLGRLTRKVETPRVRTGGFLFSLCTQCLSVRAGV